MNKEAIETTITENKEVFAKLVEQREGLIKQINEINEELLRIQGEQRCLTRQLDELKKEEKGGK